MAMYFLFVVCTHHQHTVMIILSSTVLTDNMHSVFTFNKLHWPSRSTFGNQNWPPGPLLATKSQPREPVLVTKSGPGGSLFTRATFSMTEPKQKQNAWSDAQQQWLMSMKHAQYVLLHAPLVLVVNSNLFQILWSYMLLLCSYAVLAIHYQPFPVFNHNCFACSQCSCAEVTKVLKTWK